MRQVACAAVLSLVLCSVRAAAQQDETLLKGKTESGGFGGPVIAFTPIRGEFGVFVGGRGGWIINHTLIIGGGGYGLTTEHLAPFTTPGGMRPRLEAGYGGFEAEYVHGSHKLVHWSVKLLLGGGSARWTGPGMTGAEDGFFVAEPAAHATLNISQHVRLSAGASYRIVSGVNLPEVSDGDLAGPAVVLTARFGKF